MRTSWLRSTTGYENSATPGTSATVCWKVAYPSTQWCRPVLRCLVEGVSYGQLRPLDAVGDPVTRVRTPRRRGESESI